MLLQYVIIVSVGVGSSVINDVCDNNNSSSNSSSSNKI